MLRIPSITLETILTDVEATLNSRPLAALYSTEPDLDLALTPGHFLIGRPLKAPPTKPASTAKLSYLRHWALVQRLQQDLWIAWKGCYLQSLQARSRWQNTTSTLRVNDLVYVKDETLATFRWPLAKVVAVYPGSDDRIRAVDIQCGGKIYKRAIHRLVKLHLEDESLVPALPVCSGQLTEQPPQE